MWKIVFGLFVVLTFADDRLGVCATKFGHEPGAYNVPNLIPYESSEMTYKPTGQMLPNRWYSAALNTAVVNDSAVCYSGDTCLKTINRRTQAQSLYYNVPYEMFESGSTYLFNIFMKLTNSSEDLVKISTFTRSWYKNASEHNNKLAYYKFHTGSFYKVENLWLFFSMEFKVTEQDMMDYDSVDFYLKISAKTDFMLDAASLTKVDYPDWKTEANNVIGCHRMGEIDVSIHVSEHADPNKITIQLNQTRRHFPFGVAVDAGKIAGNDSDPLVQKYRKWVTDRVTWAVFANAAKWKWMEFSERDDTDVKFELVDAALDFLESHNIKTRGHSLVWNKYSSHPRWFLEQFNKTAEILRRINYVVRHYKGRFQHYDVINEFTISRQYQVWLGREDVAEYLFKLVRQMDRNVKLFTNEWGNLEKDLHFADTVNLILRLQKQGLIDGIGLQSHLKPQADTLDMAIIKRRLEIFTGLGIPVWITELTVKHPNPVVRGRLLADSLTLYYGTRGVHGILLWDFAPAATNIKLKPTALASPDVENNAAGDKFDETLASWTSNIIVEPLAPPTPIYYGDYVITVKYDGIELAKLTDVYVTPDRPRIHLKCDLSMNVTVTHS